MLELEVIISENMAVNNSPSSEINNEIGSNSIISEDKPLNLDETFEINQNHNNESSNGLENFELSEESPQLFNSEKEIINEKIEENLEEVTEEDELDIPAFLRRQKN